MKILLKGIDIITADSLNWIIKGGNIGIRDGVIEFVCEAFEKLPDFKADRVIEGKNRLVMPGLVNSHTHCAMTLLRNFADDLALEEWLFNKVFPAEDRITHEDVYWGSMLGIAEMIKSGTTTFADMYLHMDEVARAVSETGIRANLSRSPYKFSVDGKSVACDESKACIDYYKAWNGACSGRIRVSIEVHSTYLFNEDTLRCASDLAKELDAGIQIHILETAKERRDTIEKYGMSAAEISEKCGIFDVPVIAAHCVHLSERDMEILRNRNVNVAHNPTSNLKLGSGVAMIPQMLEKGINVCLGTDGTASNNNLDMLEEMHIAALLHKGVHQNPVLVDAEQSVRMATVNGATACGFGGRTGCISKGMRADMIILDMDKPHLTPANNLLSSVVYSAQGADVDTVIIDGSIVMERRELKTIDEELVKYKAREISRRILSD